MSQIKELLTPQLPLDYRKIAAKISAGCDRKIVDYLLQHFLVSDETDLNYDLGFQFLLRIRSHIRGNQEIAGHFILYISCVIPCVAISFFKGDAESGYRSESLALDKTDIQKSRQLSSLCEFLSQCGYLVLTGEELSKELDDDLLKYTDDFSYGYFSLIFTRE